MKPDSIPFKHLQLLYATCGAQESMACLDSEVKSMLHWLHKDSYFYLVQILYLKL